MFPILPSFTPKTIVDFQSEPDEGAILGKNEADLEYALAQIRDYRASDIIPGRLLSHEEPRSDEESEEEEEEEGEGTTDEEDSLEDEDDDNTEEGEGDADGDNGAEDDGNGMDEGPDV